MDVSSPDSYRPHGLLVRRHLADVAGVGLRNQRIAVGETNKPARPVQLLVRRGVGAAVLPDHLAKRAPALV
jgi:hypothetical protein